MTPNTTFRVALCFAVAFAFASGGIAAVSACGDEIDCDGDLSVDPDEQSDDNYLTAGASGGADLSDLEDVTTEHEIHASLNTSVGTIYGDAKFGN